MPPIAAKLRSPFFLAGLLLALPLMGQTAPSPGPSAAESAAGPAAPERLSRLQGELSLDRRNKVAGVTVLVRPQDDDALLYLTSSGERGVFRVDGLVDGDYELQLSREGYVTVNKRDVTVRFPFRAVVEITMEQGAIATASPSASAQAGGGTASLQGRVTDWAGQPLSGIRLRLVRPDGTEDPRFFRTGPDGAYSMDSVSAGPWKLEVQGVGFLPLRQRFDLARDTRLQVIMVPQPAGYTPSPLDLMPAEEVLPPPGWNDPVPRDTVEQTEPREEIASAESSE